MFCRECGKELKEHTKFCTNCGTKILPVEKLMEKKTIENTQNINYISSTNKSNDKNNVWLNVLSFFIPIVGLILYIVWHNNMPKRAKGIGISSIVGFVSAIIIYVILIFSAMILVVNSSQSIIDERINERYEDYNNMKLDIQLDGKKYKI